MSAVGSVEAARAGLRAEQVVEARVAGARTGSRVALAVHAAAVARTVHAESTARTRFT